MESSLRIAILVSFVAISTCQVISFSKGCPNVNVQQNFTVEEYMGRWYEMDRFFAIFEAFSDCVSAEYTLQSGGVVTVNNTGYSHKFWSRGYNSAVGDAVAEDPRTPAKLSVRFSPGQPRGDYWVLSTDYTTYSVVWSCKEILSLGSFGKVTAQFAWILTRRPEGIPARKRERLIRLMEGYGINTSKFSATNQNNCPGR